MKTTSLVTRPPVEDCVKIKKLNGRLERNLASKGWGLGVEFFAFCMSFRCKVMEFMRWWALLNQEKLRDQNIPLSFGSLSLWEQKTLVVWWNTVWFSVGSDRFPVTCLYLLVPLLRDFRGWDLPACGFSSVALLVWWRGANNCEKCIFRLFMNKCIERLGKSMEDHHTSLGLTQNLWHFHWMKHFRKPVLLGTPQKHSV